MKYSQKMLDSIERERSEFTPNEKPVREIATYLNPHGMERYITGDKQTRAFIEEVTQVYSKGLTANDLLEVEKIRGAEIANCFNTGGEQ
jgi:hypothetical protein